MRKKLIISETGTGRSKSGMYMEPAKGLKDLEKENNDLTIEISIPCIGDLEGIESTEVKIFLTEEVHKCFQNYVSLFGILPYINHDFYIDVPVEEETFIVLKIKNYTSYNTPNVSLFSVYLVIEDITPDFDKTLKSYLTKENIAQTFSVVFPMDSYVYIKSLLSDQSKKGNINYRIKAAFLEGLGLLKKKNPLVKDDTVLERRFYAGGEQKSKIESYSTSVIISKKDVNWINNYIVQERKNNEFFSKTDFIKNLVDQLKTKYVLE